VHTAAATFRWNHEQRRTVKSTTTRRCLSPKCAPCQALFRGAIVGRGVRRAGTLLKANVHAIAPLRRRSVYLRGFGLSHRSKMRLIAVLFNHNSGHRWCAPAWIACASPSPTPHSWRRFLKGVAGTDKAERPCKQGLMAPPCGPPDR